MDKFASGSDQRIPNLVHVLEDLKDLKELDSNYSSVPWAHFLDKQCFLDYHKLPLEAWAGKSKNLNARGCWATCGAGIWTPDSSPTGLAWTLAGSVFPTHGFFKSFKSENYTQTLL